jgi:hypothetical protein
LYGGAPEAPRGLGLGRGSPLPRKKFLIFNIKTIAFWWLLGVECFFSEGKGVLKLLQLLLKSLKISH